MYEKRVFRVGRGNAQEVVGGRANTACEAQRRKRFQVRMKNSEAHKSGARHLRIHAKRTKTFKIARGTHLDARAHPGKEKKHVEQYGRALHFVPRVARKLSS